MGSAYYISVDDNGRREHPLGYGHDAKEMVERSAQHSTECAVVVYGDRLNEGVGGVFLSLL